MIHTTPKLLAVSRLLPALAAKFHLFGLRRATAHADEQARCALMRQDGAFAAAGAAQAYAEACRAQYYAAHMHAYHVREAARAEAANLGSEL